MENGRALRIGKIERARMKRKSPMEPGRGGHRLPLSAVILPGFLVDLADETMAGLGKRNLKIEVGVQR